MQRGKKRRSSWIANRSFVSWKRNEIVWTELLRLSMAAEWHAARLLGHGCKERQKGTPSSVSRSPEKDQPSNEETLGGEEKTRSRQSIEGLCVSFAP